MFVVDTDRTELDVEVHPSLFGFLVASNGDGSVTVTGATEFRAADFDVHLPGLGHLRGICHWTVVVLPR